MERGQRNARARERNRLKKRARARREAWVLTACMVPVFALGAVLKAWQFGVRGSTLVVGGAVVSSLLLLAFTQGWAEWDYRRARKADRASHDPRDFEDLP